jgi:hypothetical protein
LTNSKKWWHNVTYLFIFILFIKFKVAITSMVLDN